MLSYRRKCLAGFGSFGVVALLLIFGKVVSETVDNKYLFEGVPPVDSIPVSKGEISHITFYSESLFRDGQGSDQWPLTWGKDGNVYSAWGDGWGWSRSHDESKGFMGVTLITGVPPDVKGIDLWQEDKVNRKPLALVGDRDHLYLFYDKKDDGWDGSYVGMSASKGRSWDFSDSNRLFSLAEEGMKVIGIAQFGPGYTGLPEKIDSQFFYLYLSNRTDGKASTGRDIWLARIRAKQISDREAYEFFSGVKNERPVWSENAAKRMAVLHDADGMGYHVSVSYNKSLNQFLLVKSSRINHLGIWVGTNLWGPWRNIYKQKFLDDHWKFTYMISPKWISEDGHKLWMTFSGWPEEDRISFIRAKLEK